VVMLGVMLVGIVVIVGGATGGSGVIVPSLFSMRIAMDRPLKGGGDYPSSRGHGHGGHVPCTPFR